MRELQLREKQILLDFAKFCDDHNLKYSLSSGTLLGAVRHKGFIPWDDDIDVMMPYDDYLKFVQLFDEQNRNQNYMIYAYELGNFPLPFAKIYDKTVTLNRRKAVGFEGEEDFLWIDIFPLRKTYDDEKQHLKAFKKTKHYLLKLHGAEGKVYTRAHTWLKILIFPHYIFIKIFNGKYWLKKLMTLVDKVDRENINSNRYSCYSWGFGKKKEWIEKASVMNRSRVEFEGDMFYAFGDTDAYLKQIYGDYMTPPPASKIVTHTLIGFDSHK